MPQGEKGGQRVKEKHGAMRGERGVGEQSLGDAREEAAQPMFMGYLPYARPAFSRGLWFRAGLSNLVATSPRWHFKLKLKLIRINYN